MLPDLPRTLTRWIHTIDPRHPVVYVAALLVIGVIVIRPLIQRVLRPAPRPIVLQVSEPEGGESVVVVCPDCGARNEPGYTFCLECQATLPPVESVSELAGSAR